MTATVFRRWLPAGLLCFGAILVFGGATRQHAVPLRVPMADAVPAVLLGAESRDIEISEAEQRVAGMDTYVLREYQTPDGAAFSVYVGYYEEQAQGNTIHSPKNCLPGGGWEPLTSQRDVIATPAGDVPVNRYLLGNGPARLLVLYWYQGRGRVEANEYVVKWDLLRDQALHGRSDEALVRVMVPVTGTEEAAGELATAVASELVVHVDRALPGR